VRRLVIRGNPLAPSGALGVGIDQFCQRRAQLARLALGERLQHSRLHRLEGVIQLRKELSPRVGERDNVAAPITGVGCALHQTALGQ